MPHLLLTLLPWWALASTIEKCTFPVCPVLWLSFSCLARGSAQGATFFHNSTPAARWDFTPPVSGMHTTILFPSSRLELFPVHPTLFQVMPPAMSITGDIRPQLHPTWDPQQFPPLVLIFSLCLSLLNMDSSHMDLDECLQDEDRLQSRDFYLFWSVCVISLAHSRLPINVSRVNE